MQEHHKKHKGIPSQDTDVPDLMIAKIGWERIRFADGEADRADSVAQSASDHEDDGIHAELGVGGLDEKDHDPTHKQEGSLRKPYRNLCKEDGFECDEENCQAPDDAKQHPACRAAENGQAERCVGSSNEDVDGIMVKDAEDPIILVEQQKEMQQTAEQERQKKTDAVNGETYYVCRFVGDGCK